MSSGAPEISNETEDSESDEPTGTCAVNEIYEIHEDEEKKKEWKKMKYILPDDELCKKLPYIRKNPCIRRVMVAIHKLKYQIKKLENCKRPRCTLCQCHVEDMLSKKYFVDNTLSQGTSDQTKTKKKDKSTQTTIPVCEAVDVVFLVYCIKCDDVLLGYTKEMMKILTDVNFGFSGETNCQPVGGHNKKYLRCMVIDKNNESLFLENWKWYLQVKVMDHELLLLKLYHFNYMDDAEIKKRCPEAKNISFNSETIIYVVECYNCKKKYVGQALKTFDRAYKKLENDDNSCLSHFKNSNADAECCIRDFRWCVVDGLHEQQEQFLETCNDFFNQLQESDINIIKMIKLSFEFDVISNDMAGTVLESRSLVDFKQKLGLSKFKNNKKLKNLPYTFNQFKSDIKLWIENTKNMFLKDQQKHWIIKLKTIEAGLNEIFTGAEIGANMYNDFFKGLGQT